MTVPLAQHCERRRSGRRTLFILSNTRRLDSVLPRGATGAEEWWTVKANRTRQLTPASGGVLQTDTLWPGTWQESWAPDNYRWPSRNREMRQRISVIVSCNLLVSTMRF